MGALNATGLSREAILALAGLSLAACASAPPRYPMAGHGGGYAHGYGAAPEGPSGAHGHSSAPGKGTNKPYEINGRWYYPSDQPDYDEIGTASWYGDQFHNHATADGEVFDMNLPSAAHKTLPLPCMVEVTNLSNGKKVVVRVNDRGPFVGDRIIDMSKEAAKELGYYGQGTTLVRVRYVGRAPDFPGDTRLYQANNVTPSSEAQRPPLTLARQGYDHRPANPVLGDQIEDRPIQATPSTVTWSATRPVAAAKATPSLEPQPPPIQVADARLSADNRDIDGLLDSLTTGTSAPSGPVQQVGAFASRANAERAAAAYGGQAQVSPIEQSGRTLYKVTAPQ